MGIFNSIISSAVSVGKSIFGITRNVYHELKGKVEKFVDSHLIGKPEKIKDIINFIVKYLNSGIPAFGKVKLRKNEIKFSYPKVNKSKNILGWKPKINFYRGLKKTNRSYISQT